MKKIIALGADHQGFRLKENLKKLLVEWNIPFIDFGTNSQDSIDYPKIGLEVAQAVSQGQCFRGILICGSGIGFSIVANKIKGIRAGLCHNLKTARLSRRHNDTNILVLNKTISTKIAQRMLKVWLETKFAGGRHLIRINQIRKIEKEYLK